MKKWVARILHYGTRAIGVLAIIALATLFIHNLTWGRTLFSVVFVLIVVVAGFILDWADDNK